MIKWDDAYSTGVTTIDEQHKRLFEFVNDLQGAVQETEIDKTLILRVLDFFEKYAVEHFGKEETCMYRFKCPIAQTNQIAHQNFIETYTHYRGLLNKEGASRQLFSAISSWIEGWLMNHICKIDVQLRPYVKAKPSTNTDNN